MKIKPIKDRVLIQVDKTQEKTAGGIIIPDNEKSKKNTGRHHG